MDMRNNKQRNVSTQARVNFSQSETSSLLRGGGGGVNRKDPNLFLVAFIIILPFLVSKKILDLLIQFRNLYIDL